MREVARWPKSAKPFPTHRIYRNKDYVIFSHAGHARSGVRCTECHGEVYRQQPLVKFRDLSMKACVD
jgi:hypothetical protein